ncbi:DUF3422 family protein [Aquibaculum arenosum]|uniref:DUF3422 domain-containing protein n=1 Tax=Aquibaculum arenosum TaxID=3032591 RepID=A0ABT5YLX1_9PROT|nr:DUF3422 domain-containing protein [Fodinicurvata sp. CAU 1616]MDF2095929.1 DUF3422 domain-containing protein [Fodinicurvata sp. CAU 1616]
MRQILPVPDHPQRQLLSDEVHARPYMRLQAPERASHLALYTGEDGVEAERSLLASFCEARGASPPGPDANFHLVELDGFRLRWERHTEFSTYGFFVAGDSQTAWRGEAAQAPFAGTAIEQVPDEWLQRLPGRVLAAVHLELRPTGEQELDPEGVGVLLGSDTFSGSLVAGGAAEVWMNFTINEDGFGRVLVLDRHLGARQAGRLAQRLFEIETYRMMALLALPLARQHGSELTRIGSRLAEVTQALAKPSDSLLPDKDAPPGVDSERALLDRLTLIAAETEQIAAATAYRFGAARAYQALVERRIAELREERIEGQQTIGEFMDRRLSPAMRTCRAVAERLESLSRQVARTGQLLRTRVDVQLEAQNRDLLGSMDRRARLQLALQETVEGLSVAAITYYAIGLLAYAIKSAEDLGVALPVEVTPGLAIPLVAAAVWLGMRRVRRRLAHWVRE